MATSRHFESRPVSHSVYGTGSHVGTKYCTDEEWDELEEEQELEAEEQRTGNSCAFAAVTAGVFMFGRKN